MEFNPSRLATQLRLAVIENHFTCSVCKRRLSRSSYTAYGLVAPEATRKCKPCVVDTRRRECRRTFRAMPITEEDEYTIVDAIK